MKTSKGKQNPSPKIPIQMQSSIWQDTLFLNFQIVPEVPRIHFMNNRQGQFIDKQRYKLENSNWFNTNSIFETKLSFPKIQNKLWGAPLI